MTQRRSRRQRRPKQLDLEFPYGWGGWRPGAGRKPRAGRRNVPHRTREALSGREPIHVTMRLKDGLPTLRSPETFEVLRAAFAAAAERNGTRVVHLSVQHNHFHLIVESRDREALSRAIQGLCRRVGHALNRLWQRTGSVFGDRYHARVLSTPREVKNAIAYVLNNDKRHRSAVQRDAPDPYSSGPWFTGWAKDVRRIVNAALAPVTEATTWLLNVGWKRHGRIPLWTAPTPT